MLKDIDKVEAENQINKQDNAMLENEKKQIKE